MIAACGCGLMHWNDAQSEAHAQDVVDLVRETMCDTVLSELSAASTDARSRSRGGKQVLLICGPRRLARVLGSDGVEPGRWVTWGRTSAVS